MQAASKTLKKEQKKIKISDIDNMQDEMEDMLEDVGEISEILGRSYGMPDGIEEEDLDAELACLEDEWASEEIAEDTPASATTVPQTSESSQLADLERDFSMPVQPSRHISAPATATTAAPNANAAQPNSVFASFT